METEISGGLNGAAQELSDQDDQQSRSNWRYCISRGQQGISALTLSELRLRSSNITWTVGLVCRSIVETTYIATQI